MQIFPPEFHYPHCFYELKSTNMGTFVILQHAFSREHFPECCGGMQIKALRGIINVFSTQKLGSKCLKSDLIPGMQRECILK